jgi:hypothetical protein
MILSLYFFLRIVGGLHKNLEEIAAEMGLRPMPEPLLRQLTGSQKYSKMIGSLFDTFRHNDETARNEPLDVEAAWRTYVGRERIWPRCGRAALYTAFMFGIFIYVLIPMFGISEFSCLRRDFVLPALRQQAAPRPVAMAAGNHWSL